MKDLSYSGPGLVRTTTMTAGGTSWQDVVRPRWSRGTKVLLNTTTGDRKTPNAQEFRTWRHTSLSGSSLNVYPASRTSVYSVGDLYNPGEYQVAVPDRAQLLFNMTLSKLNEQLRGSLDLSVDFAEAGKTAHMIRQAFKVVDLARSIRRSFTGSLANKWLEYQYGWRPLVGSIYGVFDELMDKSIARQLYVTLRVRRKLREELCSTQVVGGPVTATTISKNDYRQEIGIRLKNGSLSPSIANYTSLNPVSIAWELLPYSFVVDWFVDIGGYLRNVETAMIYQRSFASGWSTYGYCSSQQATVSGYTSVPNWELSLSASGSSRLCYKKRTVLSSYPCPRYPVLNNFSLGSQRLLSAAALLRQLLK